MPVNPIASYLGDGVVPIFKPEDQLSLALTFAPNLNVRRGGLLGQVSSANAAEVQTLNFSGTWAEGDTFTISIVGIDGGTYSTPALALDSTPDYANADLDTAIESLLEAAGYYGATVAITNGPAPADTTITFGGTALYKDMPLMSVTYVTAGDGTVTIDATTPGVSKGLWVPYDDDGTDDGRRVARAISQYDFRTDYAGRVVFAKQADPSYGSVTGGYTPPQHNNYSLSAPAWFSGVFKVSDLYIWNGATSAWDQYPDANACTDLGRIICGAYNDSTGMLSVR